MSKSLSIYKEDINKLPKISEKHINKVKIASVSQKSNAKNKSIQYENSSK